MHAAAPQPRTVLARSSSTTPLSHVHVHLPSRVSTQYSFTSRKHRKPNKTNHAPHFYPVQMGRPFASVLGVIPTEGRRLARRGISPSFLALQSLQLQEFLIATIIIRNHTYLSENKGQA